MSDSVWNTEEFNAAPDTVSNKGRFLKNNDIPTDSSMILKFVDRLQKDMTPELRSKMEANGGKVGDIYWVYYFEDLSSGSPVEKEYSAFKKMTALTIAMKGGLVKVNGVEVIKPTIEKGDSFTVRRIGSGQDMRFDIVKLNGDLMLDADQIDKVVNKVIESSDAPF